MRTIKTHEWPRHSMAACLAMLIDMSLDEVLRACEKYQTSEPEGGLRNAALFMAERHYIMGMWLNDPSGIPHDVETISFDHLESDALLIDEGGFHQALCPLVWDSVDHVIRSPEPNVDDRPRDHVMPVVWIPVTKI